VHVFYVKLCRPTACRYSEILGDNEDHLVIERESREKMLPTKDRRQLNKDDRELSMINHTDLRVMTKDK